jgi:hypothetical protein
MLMSFQTTESRKARKLAGEGWLHYEVLVDQNGKRYVQIVGNDEDGSFSRLLFSVDSYGPLRTQPATLKELQGLDPHTGKMEPVSDNNVGGFLKAVLKNLLDDPV